METFSLEELRMLAYIVGTFPALPEKEIKPLRDKIKKLCANALTKDRESIHFNSIR